LNQLYAGTLPDTLAWLLHNDVRYILWLPRDNSDLNSRFGPLREAIKPRYYWHNMCGDEKTLAVGFWVRIDDPPAK
jgi:hypothetical protein